MRAAPRGVLPLAISLMLVYAPARGEPDVFMRAVGFALTGSDDVEPKAIDRAKCVFGIKKEVFRLNNVHTDRVVVQGWNRKTAWGEEQWVTVELHGDEVVYEKTSEPLTDDGSDFLRQYRVAHPEAFTPHHYTYKEYKLKLSTGDQDRVTRAWKYIYDHGCAGKQSPF